MIENKSKNFKIPKQKRVKSYFTGSLGSSNRNELSSSVNALESFCF
jgi:hypothetical protein